MQQQQQQLRNFNGGKMQHLFAVPREQKHRFYLPEFVSKEAEAALCSGKARFFLKIDGSCGALIREKGTWTLYQRYDDAKNRFKESGLPANHIPLPQDCENKADREGHHYSFRRLARPVPGSKLKGEDKWVAELYAALDVAKLDDLPDFNSVELVGPNYNRTPGVARNNLALHSEQVLEKAPPVLDSAEAWLLWLEKFFAPAGDAVLHEGLVLEHEGRWWKIRADNIASLAKLRKQYLPPASLKIVFQPADNIGN